MLVANEFAHAQLFELKRQNRCVMMMDFCHELVSLPDGCHFLLCLKGYQTQPPLQV